MIWSLVSWYFWARYLVASSDISAIREIFLATTFVLVEAAINHSGVPGTCLALLLYISFSSFSNLSSIVFCASATKLSMSLKLTSGSRTLGPWKVSVSSSSTTSWMLEEPFIDCLFSLW